MARFPGLADRLKRLIGQADSVASSSMRAESRQKMTLPPGDTIDDFDLLTRLGSGVFATVFLARQTSMQYVAGASLSGVQGQLRLLPKSDWSGTALLKAISRQLQESGSGFGVTGTAHEQPLHRRLQKATRPDTVCLFGIQVASAPQSAHEQGVLHRDLKPANILLHENGAPRIVDFNISFCSKLDEVSPAADFGGSLACMSPEQLEVCHSDHAREADDVDARSDQYSLSVLLWEMLCGQPPFNSFIPGRNAARDRDTVQNPSLKFRVGISRHASIRMLFWDCSQGRVFAGCLIQIITSILLGAEYVQASSEVTVCGIGASFRQGLSRFYQGP